MVPGAVRHNCGPGRAPLPVGGLRRGIKWERRRQRTHLLPHAVGWHTPGMQVASLDHVMWFHEPFRADEWLLYAIESPKAHGARGLVRGKVFTKDGRLVASTAQEGLIRKREKH